MFSLRKLLLAPAAPVASFPAAFTPGVLCSALWSLLALLALATPALPVQAETVLHKERSLYSTVVVKQSGNRRCLMFSVRRQQRNQSCMNMRHPRQMQFAYTKMAMSALLFVPQPQSILVVGLGGGTLPTAFHELFPDTVIDVVEIDPAVTRVAKEFFDFRPAANMRVYDQDARVWTKRAMLNKAQYDIIILDAFNGEYIPEHLMTVEYLRETAALLAPAGVLFANTFSISDLYDHESTTYAHVFGSFINFKLPESANRMVIVQAEQPGDQALKDAAAGLRETLAPYDVPIRRLARVLVQQRQRRPDWNRSARVLTDQYSPANLLQSR